MHWYSKYMSSLSYCLFTPLSYPFHRDNGEWDNLPPRERQQNEGNLAHVGRIARCPQKSFLYSSYFQTWRNEILNNLLLQV